MIYDKSRQNMTKRTAHNAPHPLDVALGGRIRLRRSELELSQSQLAQQVGITFQQIQKYERGVNRVSFSRLAGIAEALRCSVTDIIDGLGKGTTSSGPSLLVTRLNEPGAAELLEAYCAIRPNKRRRALVNLVRQLAD